MFGKPSHPATAARSVVFGVLLAILIVYLVVNIAEIISGNHYVDYLLIRRLALLGLIVVLYGWWENR